jgi:flagellar basal-body rod modification protein FlgD
VYNLAINTVNTNYNSLSTTERKVKSELGKDEFLKILVTQLQNQDPMNPMQDSEFISQMAQFSALEQMTALNSSFEMSRAFSLVGKNVYAEISDDGATYFVNGKVDKVSILNGQAYATVGEAQVKISDIKEVYNNSENTEEVI